LDIHDISHSNRTVMSSSKRVDSNPGFKKILDAKMDGTSRVLTPSHVDGRAKIIEQGDRITDLLDDYARALADPGRTLKDIAPVVRRIEKETGILEAEADLKLGDDKALGKMVGDLAAMAHVAVFKFNRGDYL